jgi:hypothetical protein
MCHKPEEVLYHEDGDSFIQHIPDIIQCSNLEVFYPKDEITCLPQNRGNQATRLHCVKMQNLSTLKMH